MRYLGWGAGVALLGMALSAVNVEAVPSFTRQTGMTCNQCHVSFGAPVPNFTFTGKKFRMNGYRMPFVADKIEAGEVGAIDGNRLSIPLAPYLSFRYQSVFASQSKSPGADEAGPIESNPTSRLSFFPGGAIGDYIGAWVEFYLTPDGSTTGEWTQGLFSYDEYDLRFVHVAENTTLGFAFNNQGIKEISGFGPWPVGLTSNINNGGFAGWSHPNRGNFFLYGWFNDRILGVIGASPGNDNLDWDERNYQAGLGYAIFNSDAREMWIASFVKVGDDDIPMASRTVPSRDGTLSWRYLDTVTGITATRAPDAGPYLAADIGDIFRSDTELRYGFVDNGPHSMEGAVRLAINKDTYADNAELTDNALGLAIRYVYNRTWGLDATLDNKLTYEFQDAAGQTYDIDSKPNWSLRGSFRPAMNFIVQGVVSNSQRNFLTQDAETGWSWSLSVDYLY